MKAWGLAKYCELSVNAYDSLHLVYHSGTGQTHLLDAQAFAVLAQFFNRRPLDYQKISELVPIKADQSEQGIALDAILGALESASLIEASDTPQTNN